MENSEIESTQGNKRAVTRRTIVKGAAWSLPVISVAVAAPASAATLNPPVVPDLSLNGWIQHNREGNGRYTVYGNPTQNPPALPAGFTPAAVPTPWGFYVLGATPANTITNARLINWYSSDISPFSPVAGSSPLWSTPTYAGTRDFGGVTYYGYQTNYLGTWTQIGSDMHAAASNFAFEGTFSAAGAFSLYTQRIVNVDGTDISFTRGPVSWA